MLNLYNTAIEGLSLHRTGNKSRNEKVFLSEEPYLLDDELRPLLKEFFFKPFRDKEETYFQFAHAVDLMYNDMFAHCAAIFENPDKLHEVSKLITAHLWNQSNHPHIKTGEVFVAYLKNITVDNVPTDAIGIFKAEVMSDFLEPAEEFGNLAVHLKTGISLDKLDKGCLIFNTKKETGYKILCVDQNRYDSRYWLEHFLGVDASIDEHFLTKNYMKFAAAFAKDIVFPDTDKKEEVMFVNRTVNFFAKNDEFKEEEFVAEVLDNEELFQEFKVYKSDHGSKWSIEDVSNFPISPTAVTATRNKLQNTIKLDTNITIQLDFINPESAEKFIKKGWDGEKQMHYYLVYFNNELK